MRLLCMRNCGSLSHYVMSSGLAVQCVAACWRVRARDAQVNKTTLALVHHCLRDKLQVFSKDKEKRILKGS